MANGDKLTTTTGRALTPAERYRSLGDLLKRNEGIIAEALPRHLTVERMVRLALTAVRTTPELLECDQTSFLSSLLVASQLGLEPDGVLGMAYLIPFWNRKKKPPVREVQFIPGYQGLKALAYRTGEVEIIQARSVYEGDHFKVVYGVHEDLVHVPGDRAFGETPILGCYAIARLKSGLSVFEWMPTDEIEAIRQKASSAESPAWVNWWPEMGKKTSIRRLCKTLPRSVELATALTLNDAVDRGAPQNLSELLGRSGDLDPAMEIKVGAENGKATAGPEPGEPTEAEKAAILAREKEESDAHAHSDSPAQPVPTTRSKPTNSRETTQAANRPPWERT